MDFEEVNSFAASARARLNPPARSITRNLVRMLRQRGSRRAAVAFGVARGREQEYAMAVRLPRTWRSAATRGGVAEELRAFQHRGGELDVRYYSPLVPLAGYLPVHVPSGGTPPVSGAVCCIIQHRGQPALLSCSHVVAGCDLRPDGAEVRTTAWGSDEELGSLAFKGLLRRPDPVDAAVVAPSVDLARIRQTLGPLAGLVGDRRSLLGTDVEMSGPISSYATGSVTAVNAGPLTVDFTALGGPVLDLSNLVEVRTGPGVPFARSGDSGSLVRTSDGAGVGMVVACDPFDDENDPGPPTVLAPLDDILDTLGATLS